MRQIALVIGASVALAACQSVGGEPAARQTVAFDAKAAAFITKKGAVSIKGHAFLRRRDGVTVDAAGEIVRLIPATPYAEERFRRLYQGKKFAGGVFFAPQQDVADPEYSKLLRETKAEANGTFRFDNVAAGRYFIATQLQYQHSSKYFLDGGAFYDEVTVTGKELDPVLVVLSGN